MTEQTIEQLATALHQKRLSVSEIEPLSKENGEFPLETAYKIQQQGVQLRLNEEETLVGYKMGLTSKAKMEQMGLHQPIFGVLTNKMALDNGSSLTLSDHIHPKAEPEMYFMTNKELKGSVTRDEALEACSAIGVAIEILDSRYRGFKYFTLPDVVADNSSSAFYVLGEKITDFEALDLTDLHISISDGKEISHEAKTSAILGDPLLSLCELITLLNQQRKSLPAGSLVLAGAATVAIQLKEGDQIHAEISSVGKASFQVNA